MALYELYMKMVMEGTTTIKNREDIEVDEDAISISCDHVLIGIKKFQNAMAQMTKSGFFIVINETKGKSKTLKILHSEIAQVNSIFGNKKINAIFIYVFDPCSKYICEEIGMTEDPPLDPSNKIKNKIILQLAPTNVNRYDEIKLFFEKHESLYYNNINEERANELIKSVTDNQKTVKSTTPGRIVEEAQNLEVQESSSKLPN